MDRQLLLPKARHGQTLSRRRMVIGGAIAGLTTNLGLSALGTRG